MNTNKRSSKRGTSTSAAKRPGPDAIEALILKEDLRIADVHPHKDLDLLVIVLNSGDVLQARISDFDRLSTATETQLKKWRLIGGGLGLHWKELDEDLSLKGFIRESAQQEALRRMSFRKAVTRSKVRS